MNSASSSRVVICSRRSDSSMVAIDARTRRGPARHINSLLVCRHSGSWQVWCLSIDPGGSGLADLSASVRAQSRGCAGIPRPAENRIVWMTLSPSRCSSLTAGAAIS